MKTISEMAFSGAPLENVEFSEGLESIGDNAFEGHKLARLLPDSLKATASLRSRAGRSASIKVVGVMSADR